MTLLDYPEALVCRQHVTAVAVGGGPGLNYFFFFCYRFTDESEGCDMINERRKWKKTTVPVKKICFKF